MTAVRIDIADPGLREAAEQAARALVKDGVPAALAAGDPSLWGADAEPEAATRLGWLRLPSTSRDLLPELARLREAIRADGLDHVVLAGMGGSSLAPEVICAAAGVELTVLDTTDPEQVARALADRLDRTVVVVASKSGTTVETDSHRRIYEQAFRHAGLSADRLARRFVVVTDPGTSLESFARDAGYHVVLADPTVGGRYSALSAFGLVPSALAGADVAGLLDDAAALAPTLAGETDNPGLLLGAALGAAAQQGRDKLVLAGTVTGLAALPDWIEQLIAESTGKLGRGILPAVVGDTADPGWTEAGADTVRAALANGADRADGADRAGAGAGGPGDLSVVGPLGAQFLLWEYGTAIAGRMLRINPFDQPNVAESKHNTNALLDRLAAGEPVPAGEQLRVEDSIALFGDPVTFAPVIDLASALVTLAKSVPEHGYLAVLAYLDRIGQEDAAALRPTLAGRMPGRVVTFGWGPRFLHSTGQYHKGGPEVGSYLIITGETSTDIQVPGQPFTLRGLQLAQALGDIGALTARVRPVLRLHLLDRAKGLRQLLDHAAELSVPEPQPDAQPPKSTGPPAPPHPESVG